MKNLYRWLSRVALIFLAQVAPALLTHTSGPERAPQIQINEESYSIAAGRGRAVDLADGSWAFLYEGTEIHATYTQGLMEIAVKSGRALFHVKHASARVFRVIVGHAKIEDLGTQFEVIRLGRDASVTVIEGEVQVSVDANSAASEIVAAGEKVNILLTGAFSASGQPPTTAAPSAGPQPTRLLAAPSAMPRTCSTRKAALCASSSKALRTTSDTWASSPMPRNSRNP